MSDQGAATGPVPGFEASTFSYGGREREVYLAGSGPAVIVIHEMPGLHPGVTAFGQRLVDAGYRVYLPSLFGRPGMAFSGRGMAGSMLRACVSREFAMLADRTSPVASWLRALAAQAHAECGGPGVGAVGMCFTGGFALAMAVEPAVLAPVVSQPGLPVPLGGKRRAGLGLDAADLTAVKARAAQQGLCVLGLRFSHDMGSPPERFQALRRELGAGFEAVEIDSSPGNPHGIGRRAHSVLTVELVDEPGHPTRAALDRVMTFLDERLRPPPA
ncbi:MAG TPA: dienelactone hydrolase family protein [Streptosporangiaceae bacterium]|jgi:dienelactone hydrolase